VIAERFFMVLTGQKLFVLAILTGTVASAASVLEAWL